MNACSELSESDYNITSEEWAETNRNVSSNLLPFKTNEKSGHANMVKFLRTIKSNEIFSEYLEDLVTDKSKNSNKLR